MKLLTVVGLNYLDDLSGPTRVEAGVTHDFPAKIAKDCLLLGYAVEAPKAAKVATADDSAKDGGE